MQGIFYTLGTVALLVLFPWLWWVVLIVIVLVVIGAFWANMQL